MLQKTIVNLEVEMLYSLIEYFIVDKAIRLNDDVIRIMKSSVKMMDTSEIFVRSIKPIYDSLNRRNDDRS